MEVIKKMTSQLKESHKTSEWILRDKRIVYGEGISGNEVRSYLTSYECKHCFEIYTRFVDQKDFEELEVDNSKWEWGWEK